MRKDDEEIFKKEETEDAEEDAEEDNEQDKIYSYFQPGKEIPSSVREIFKGVRSRELTPRVRTFQEKLQMLKNKKQRRLILQDLYKIDFLKIETTELREKLDEIIED